MSRLNGLFLLPSHYVFFLIFTDGLNSYLWCWSVECSDVKYKWSIMPLRCMKSKVTTLSLNVMIINDRFLGQNIGSESRELSENIIFKESTDVSQKRHLKNTLKNIDKCANNYIIMCPQLLFVYKCCTQGWQTGVTLGEDTIGVDEGYLFAAPETRPCPSDYSYLGHAEMKRSCVDSREIKHGAEREISHTGCFQSSWISYLHPQWRRGFSLRRGSSCPLPSSHSTSS